MKRILHALSTSAFALGVFGIGTVGLVGCDSGGGGESADKMLQSRDAQMKAMSGQSKGAPSATDRAQGSIDAAAKAGGKAPGK